MAKHTQRIGRFSSWMTSERRLIFGYEDRKHALENADQQNPAKKVSSNPEDTFRSETERLANEFKHINSWWNTIMFQRGRRQSQALNAATERSLNTTSAADWNANIFRRIWSFGERRVLFAKVREQRARDLLTYFQNRRTTLMERKSAVSGSLAWLKGQRAAVSAKELKYFSKFSADASRLVTRYETKNLVIGKASFEKLQSLREAEGILREALGDKVTESELETMLTLTDDGRALYSAIEAHFPDDRGHRKNLNRLTKQLVRMKRYKLLDAAVTDIPNTLQPKELVKKIDDPKMRGRDVIFTLNGSTIRGKVTTRSSPMITLKVVGAQGEQYMVMDVKEGFLMSRDKDGKERDHNILQLPNKIELPPSSLRALAA